MSFKCAFSSIAFHRARTSRFLSADISKPALILCTQNIGVRYAGHSHWQNIKKTKETKDLAKSRAYNGFIRLIRKEILNGSSDPKLNTKLANVISQAQAINMPLTTINNAIKRCEYWKKNPHRQLLHYHAINGVMYMVEIASENLGRTRMEINSLFKKQNIGKSESNLKSAFIPKCHVVAKPPEGTPNPLEQTVEDAIEVGAEEVEPAEDLPDYFRVSHKNIMYSFCLRMMYWQLNQPVESVADPNKNIRFCKFTDNESSSATSREMNIIKSKLEKRNYTIASADPFYVPKSPVELPEEELEKLYDFVQKLEDHAEVERVIINVV